MQIALVVDERKRLLGTVTDGDVRRGILRGIDLNDPVKRIMRRKPIVSKLGDEEDRLFALMKKKHIHHVPIVDDAGCVLGVKILDEILGPRSKPNWVVLMVGGLGTRLRPLTEDTPKPLLNVGNKPISETILNSFVEQGFHRFYFAVNYKDEMLREYFGDGSRWNADIRYLKENRRLGTAGAISLLPERPKHPIIVMNGDLLTKVNYDYLFRFHHANQAKATMCVREYDLQVPFGVVQFEKDFMTRIDEKPSQRFFVNAGIYVLEPEVLDQIPRNKVFDMTQLFEGLIKQKQKTAVFPIREYWLDIGRLEDLERANGEVAALFGPSSGKK